MNNSDANNKVIANLLKDEIRLGSTINFFKLYPHTNDRWTIQQFIENDFKDVDFDQAFIVDFDSITNSAAYDKLPEDNKLEIELQQSVTFVVDIANINECFEWRFSKGGSTLTMDMDTPNYRIKTQVKNQGKTLIIKVNNVRYTTFDNFFDFRFIAVCLNKNSGGELDQVYYSQDPRIGVRRPTH